MDTKTRTTAIAAITSEDGVLFSAYTASGHPVESQQAVTWEAVSHAASSVERLSLGSLGEAVTAEIEIVLNSLASSCPALRHLHLWGLTKLIRLPALPQTLCELDIQGCHELTKIESLPSAGLESLILRACEKLETVPAVSVASVGALAEVSLKNCRALEPGWLEGLLACVTEAAALNRGKGLRRLDVVGCGQITRVSDLPCSLQRLNMGGCSALVELPGGPWPPELYRLELNGTAIETLPPIPAHIDFLDLSECRQLRGLGFASYEERDFAKAAWPRTLFLYRSAIKKPPASVHGASKVNVAGAVYDFYKAIATVGEADLFRCKLLILGNGSAGKTIFATRYARGEARELGTTHNIQFFPIQKKLSIDAQMQNVDVSLWDFGGQEIYHNAHRLFMERGSIFIVLWKYSQDFAEDADMPSVGAYVDTLYPPEYWVDFILLACPDQPQLHFICSHADEWDGTHYSILETGGKRLSADEAFTEHQKNFALEVALSHYDAKEDRGHADGRDNLHEWIDTSIAQTVAAEGTGVPTYWKLAADMVSGWLEAFSQEPAGSFLETNPQVTLAEFQSELLAYLKSQVSPETDLKRQYSRLAGAMERGDFNCSEAETDRCLEFLTNIGLLYWNPTLVSSSGGLSECRVILNQQWALKAIYCILDARSDNAVYQSLVASDGVFSVALLDQYNWGLQEGATFSTADKQVLVEFMTAMSICFSLKEPGREQLTEWQAQKYVSFKHLPSYRKLQLDDKFAAAVKAFSARDAQNRVVSDIYLHEAYIQTILSRLAQQHGARALYAKNGFFLEKNEEGQSICIQFKKARREIKGSVVLYVCGPKCEERLNDLEEFIKKEVPEKVDAIIRSDARQPSDAAGTVKQKKKVFVSYRRPSEGTSQGEDQAGELAYREMVDTVFAELEGDAQIELQIDRGMDRFHDEIVLFMKKIEHADKVVLIYSERYFKSWFCMYELMKIRSKQDVFVIMDSGFDYRKPGAMQQDWSVYMRDLWSDPEKANPDSSPAEGHKIYEARIDETYLACRTRFSNEVVEKFKEGLPYANSDVLDCRGKWSDNPKTNKQLLKKLSEFCNK